MKNYKLSLVYNVKRGFLTIPFGCVSIVGLYVIIITGITWQTIILSICLLLLGLPGLFLHIFYLIHDIGTSITYDSNGDYFIYTHRRQKTTILFKDIARIEKINHNNRFILWWGYSLFKINMTHGEIYSITNLSIEFDQLYDMIKLKDRQLIIADIYRFI